MIFVIVLVEIGGCFLLIWVVCYYYDIGKIKYVSFFVENLFLGVENLYNFLLLEDSKYIIFGYVIDGVKILEDYNML